MAAYFFDGSAIVKRYVYETGTLRVQSIAGSAAHNRIYLATITTVEVVSAITRRARGGGLSVTDAAAAVAAFYNHLVTGYFEIEVTYAVIARARRLAQVHALRGYDAVQLAAALEANARLLNRGLPPLTSISADMELNTAANFEGLAVDDPNTHP